MPSDNLVYELALTLIPKIGAITAKKLIAYVGSPEGVFAEKNSNLRKIPGIGNYLAAQISLRNYMAEAEAELENMTRSKISCVYFQDPAYPWRLKNCEDGPLMLFYKGKPDFNRTKVLSIVGTRNSTEYGKEACRVIISELSVKYPDLVIVSGLAYGIDILAHRFALEYKLDTFAVLAHGLNTIYPSSHLDTARRIMNQGGLLSDFHSRVKPERNNFLRRNRIIAGLSEATLVIESGEKGGALITAELASSYNRDVFAIPGRINDPYSAGCNYLIKANIAAITEAACDLEKALNWEAEHVKKEALLSISTPLNEEEKRILKEISSESGIGQEILSSRTGIPIHKLVANLLQMELKNWISSMPGNIYRANVRIDGPSVKTN